MHGECCRCLILPLRCTVTLGVDPIVDALHKPATRPLLFRLLLFARLAPLETPGDAAHVIVVTPLETAPASVPLLVPLLLTVAGPNHLVAFFVVLEIVIIVFRNIEVFSLADHSTVLLGSVSVLLNCVLLIFLLLSALLVVSGLALSFRTKSDIADIVRQVIPLVVLGLQLRSPELVIHFSDLDEPLTLMVSFLLCKLQHISGEHTFFCRVFSKCQASLTSSGFM